MNLNKKLFYNSKINANNPKNLNDFNNIYSSNVFNFDSILKSLKSSSNFNNINLNFFYSYTLDFRYDLFKLISFNNYYISNNFSHKQILCMRDFIKNKPFKILQCDKNIGFLLISNEDFL